MDLLLTNSENPLSFFFFYVQVSCVIRGELILSVCVLDSGVERGHVYILYSLHSCITKHSPQYTVLMVGRILGGIATSLLNSAFESWLIAEHNKVSLSLIFFYL